MGDEESLRPGRLERLDRLVEREVSARLAVEVAAEKRRFTDEEIGIARRFDQLVRRGGVARVRQHGAVRLHSEGVRLEPCSAAPACGVTESFPIVERRVGLVLREIEGALEHVGEAETLAELGEELRSGRLHPELGLPRRAVRSAR